MAFITSKQSNICMSGLLPFILFFALALFSYFCWCEQELLMLTDKAK